MQYYWPLIQQIPFVVDEGDITPGKYYKRGRLSTVDLLSLTNSFLYLSLLPQLVFPDVTHLWLSNLSEAKKVILNHFEMEK